MKTFNDILGSLGGVVTQANEAKLAAMAYKAIKALKRMGKTSLSFRSISEGDPRVEKLKAAFATHKEGKAITLRFGADAPKNEEVEQVDPSAYLNQPPPANNAMAAAFQNAHKA